MDETELLKRLEAQEATLADIKRSVDTMRKYSRIAFWTTILLFVVPLVALMFVLPWAMSSYLGSFSAAMNDTGAYDQTNLTQQLDLLNELLR